MARDRGIVLAVIALVVFILGGVATFSGLGLLAFMRYRDVYGLGSGYSMGISLTVVGLILSISGVLLMRIFRNRF